MTSWAKTLHSIRSPKINQNPTFWNPFGPMLVVFSRNPTHITGHRFHSRDKLAIFHRKCQLPPVLRVPYGGNVPRLATGIASNPLIFCGNLKRGATTTMNPSFLDCDSCLLSHLSTPLDV